MRRSLLIGVPVGIGCVVIGQLLGGSIGLTILITAIALFIMKMAGLLHN